MGIAAVGPATADADADADADVVVAGAGHNSLIAALTRYLADHGSTVVTGKTVTRLILDGERCVGVETADGGQYRAAKAVLSTVHVTHLRDMAPKAVWPEEFHYSVDTYDAGIPGFGVYLATSAPPVFETADRAAHTAVSAGTVGWPQDVIGLGEDLRGGSITGAPGRNAAMVLLHDLGHDPAEVLSAPSPRR